MASPFSSPPGPSGDEMTPTPSASGHEGWEMGRPNLSPPGGPIFPRNLLLVSTAGRTAPWPHPSWAGITLTPRSLSCLV